MTSGQWFALVVAWALVALLMTALYAIRSRADQQQRQRDASAKGAGSVFHSKDIRS